MPGESPTGTNRFWTLNTVLGNPPGHREPLRKGTDIITTCLQPKIREILKCPVDDSGNFKYLISLTRTAG